jgi:hypothetical protein
MRKVVIAAVVDNSAKSLVNLKADLDVVKGIQKRLKDIGCSKTHRNYTVLTEAWKKYIKDGTVLCKKLKEYELQFSFRAAWYDRGEKASITGLVGVYKGVIIKNYEEEYLADKKAYPHGFVVEEFVAGKLKELCNKTGIKVMGGSSNYNYGNGKVSLQFVAGEIK